MATKAGISTFIRTENYRPGDHPELSEQTVRKFVAEFATSGADRGHAHQRQIRPLHHP